jgi:acyl-homoserine lactone acylase PvdQ
MFNGIGPDTDKWVLGNVLKMKYEAVPFDEIPVLGSLWSAKKPLGGSTSTVFLSYIYFVKSEPSISSIGLEGKGSANYRQVIDMGHIDDSIFISDTGQSEGFLSEYFFDQNEGCVTGKLLDMHTGEENAKKNQKYFTKVASLKQEAPKDEF